MIGIVRIYAELHPEVPRANRASDESEYFKVLDVEPEHVPQLRRALRRQGYETICVPL